MTLEAAREALARGAWDEARQLFDAVLAAGPSAEALEGRGLAAWWLDRADLVFDSRERAYQIYRERDDRLGAARVAVWLAWDSAAFRGERAVASGWLQRARRLLEDAPDSAERAWLEVRTGAFAIFEDSDPSACRAHAAEAIRAARAAGNTDFEMIGRALDGVALVTIGQVADGLRVLDEVNAAVLAGEVRDWVAIGLSCCYLIAACERIRDFARAVEWCIRLKAFCIRTGLRPLFAVCRTQYASVCMWRGTWAEAEEELIAATDELAACRPAMTSEGLVRLAELRRRQGRADEALALLDQAEAHPAATIGRAEIALDRGDARTAADLADRFLRRLPSVNRTERAAGLDTLVRAACQLHEVDRAATALTELEHIARDVATVPLQASASLAAGVVAAERHQDERARQHFEDAVDRFQTSSAPFETAKARMQLAGVLIRLGQPDAGRHEIERAREAFAGMKAASELVRAQALLSAASSRETQVQPGAAAPGPAEPPFGLSRREVEVLRLVAEGLSNQDIAARLFLSEHTVHRHVANILTKLDVSTRAAAAALAARRGLLS